MYTATLKTLKEKIDALEKSLLVISSVCDVAEEHITGEKTPLNSCAYVTVHLMEHAMYQVEAVRVMIDDMQKLPMRVTA